MNNSLNVENWPLWYWQQTSGWEVACPGQWHCSPLPLDRQSGSGSLRSPYTATSHRISVHFHCAQNGKLHSHCMSYHYFNDLSELPGQFLWFKAMTIHHGQCIWDYWNMAILCIIFPYTLRGVSELSYNFIVNNVHVLTYVLPTRRRQEIAGAVSGWNCLSLSASDCCAKSCRVPGCQITLRLCAGALTNTACGAGGSTFQKDGLSHHQRDKAQSLFLYEIICSPRHSFISCSNFH